MKRACIRHPKTDALMDELNISRTQALGILVMLWDWTGEYAPQGDIGRFSNKVIARAVEWPAEKADHLVDVLVKCRWLDELPEEQGRLQVHDYADHREEWVTRRIKRGMADPPASRPCRDSVETPSSQRLDRQHQHQHQHQHHANTKPTPQPGPASAAPVPARPDGPVGLNSSAGSVGGSVGSVGSIAASILAKLTPTPAAAQGSDDPGAPTVGLGGDDPGRRDGPPPALANGNGKHDPPPDPRALNLVRRQQMINALEAQRVGPAKAEELASYPEMTMDLLERAQRATNASITGGKVNNSAVGYLVRTIENMLTEARAGPRRLVRA